MGVSIYRGKSRCMYHIGIWITKAKNAHSGYIILTAFPFQQWLQERAKMLRLYVYCMSCLKMRGFQPWRFNRDNLWLR
jgi:hypothetical protein